MRLLGDFKKFLFRGNVVDLAVAVVVGTAFVALVKALVSDLLTPIIALIFGKPNFEDLSFTINGSHFLLRRLPQRADHVRVDRRGGVLLRGRAGQPPDGAARKEDPDTKECPECTSAIPVNARRCPLCTSQLQPA